MLAFIMELLYEISAMGFIAVAKRIILRQKPPVVIDIGEDISLEATTEDLQELYTTICKIIDLKDELAEEVSKSDWESYKPYFSGREHYEQLVKEWGEKDAVLLELVISLSNPLLEDRLKSEKPLSELININDGLIRKIRSPRLSIEVESLFRLQDEGQRNWIQGLVHNTIDSNVRS